MKGMTKWLWRVFAFIAIMVFGGCSEPQTRTYYLRSYGPWIIGEARTCLLYKSASDVPCFTSEQMQNGAKADPQHGYLVSVTFDKPIPDTVLGVVCRLDSDSHASCHIP